MRDWKDSPTETGYWWFLREGDQARPEIVWFAASSGHVFHHGEDETTPFANEDKGKYLGPLMPPDDRFRADCHFTNDPTF